MGDLRSMCTVKAQCKGILKMRGFMGINQVQLWILGNSPSHPTPIGLYPWQGMRRKLA
jgi:hypothetical protein